jgi:hypothetical protein
MKFVELLARFQHRPNAFRAEAIAPRMAMYTADHDGERRLVRDNPGLFCAASNALVQPLLHGPTSC